MINYLKGFIIIFLLCFTAVQAKPKIEARTAILLDYQSGEILYELQPDHSIHPASMTKIMTSIVAFDLLKIPSGTQEINVNLVVLVFVVFLITIVIRLRDFNFLILFGFATFI